MRDRILSRIVAGTFLAVVIGIGGVVWGHITKPAHDVAENRLQAVESHLGEIGENLRLSMIEQARQGAILESIEKQLDTMNGRRQ